MSDGKLIAIIVAAFVALNIFALWYDPLFTMIVLWRLTG